MEYWSVGVTEICWLCRQWGNDAPGSSFPLTLTRVYGRRMQFARRPSLHHSRPSLCSLDKRRNTLQNRGFFWLSRLVLTPLS
jgi:hypothetical protein